MAQHRRNVLIGALLFLVALCGCPGGDGQAEFEVLCEDAGIQVVLTVQPPAELAQGADLSLTGTALHPQDLAIRQFELEGTQVVSTALNFSTWTAVLPYHLLAIEEDAEGPVLLDLSTRVLDSCGREMIGTLPVTLYLETGDGPGDDDTAGDDDTGDDDTAGDDDSAAGG